MSDVHTGCDTSPDPDEQAAVEAMPERYGEAERDAELQAGWGEE